MDHTQASFSRVLVVVGTRPEAIKMIPVIRALEGSGIFRPVVIATGQHTSLMSDLMTATGMMVDANLRVAEEIDGVAPSLNDVVARVISGIDSIWRSQSVPEKLKAMGRRTPEGAVACLVHGDTSSAAAAALAAFNLQLPVVHVEAGLRTSNMLAPFPEEGNRQIISRLAALHLAPTPENQMNLVREGIDRDRIVITGNTSIDMLRWAVEQTPDLGPGLEQLTANPEAPIVLVTAHRRENWGDGLRGIARAVRELAEAYPAVQFVVPMHPNPVARDAIREQLTAVENAWLVEPRDYSAFALLMQRALLVITDSGGVQEEAPALGTPVLVTRDTTERSEGLAAGTLTLVGTDPERIVMEARRLLDDPAERSRRSELTNPYGDGHAADRIVQALAQVFYTGPTIGVTVPDDQLRYAVRRRLGLGLAATV